MNSTEKNKPKPPKAPLEIPDSRRWRVAMTTMIILLIIGVLAFIFDPQYLDELGSYMVAVVLPIIGYLLAETWRSSRGGYGGFGGGYFNRYRHDHYNYRDNDNEINNDPNENP